MERRDFLATALAGSLCWPLAASAQQPRVSRTKRSASATPGRRQPTAEEQRELDQILEAWEKKTANIERLRGTHERHTYDNVYLEERRGEGSFWFEAPDKGRLDVEPPSTTVPAQLKKDGKIYSVRAEDTERWICDGENILVLTEAGGEKVYHQQEIPPEMRGTNIVNSPLPFLFGMKAETAKQRYAMSLGNMHNPFGKIPDIAKLIHIVAVPLDPRIAREWSRAEVLLDVSTFLPAHIRLLDPSGNRETVYSFKDPSVNEKFWLKNPFKYSTRGYRLGDNGKARPQGGKPEAPARQPILPTGGTRK